MGHRSMVPILQGTTTTSTQVLPVLRCGGCADLPSPVGGAVPCEDCDALAPEDLRGEQQQRAEDEGGEDARETSLVRSYHAGHPGGGWGGPRPGLRIAATCAPTAPGAVRGQWRWDSHG